MKMERYLLICVIVLSVLSLIVGLFFMNRIKDTILSHLPKSWRKEEKLYRYVNDDGNVYLLPEHIAIRIKIIDRILTNSREMSEGCSRMIATSNRMIASSNRKIKISREIKEICKESLARNGNQVPNSTIQSVQVQDQDNLFRGDV